MNIVDQLDESLQENIDKPLTPQETTNLIKDLRTKLLLFETKLKSIAEENNNCAALTAEFGKLYANMNEIFSTDDWLRSSYKDIARLTKITPELFGTQTEINKKLIDLVIIVPKLIRFINTLDLDKLNNPPIMPIKKEDNFIPEPQIVVLDTTTIKPQIVVPETTPIKKIEDNMDPIEKLKTIPEPEELSIINKQNLETEEESVGLLSQSYFESILNYFTDERPMDDKQIRLTNAYRDKWRPLSQLLNKSPQEKEAFIKMWIGHKFPVTISTEPDIPCFNKNIRGKKINQIHIETIINYLNSLSNPQ